MYTKREKEVLDLLITGKKNKEIAEILCITEHTVKAHIDHIYEKSKVHSRIELIIKELTKNKEFEQE